MTKIEEAKTPTTWGEALAEDFLKLVSDEALIRALKRAAGTPYLYNPLEEELINRFERQDHPAEKAG